MIELLKAAIAAVNSRMGDRMESTKLKTRLVLGRRFGERTILRDGPDEIIVSVERHRCGVRLVIEAPPHVRISREELEARGDE